jgi:predicted AlkP superfamily phosphohydrolase/phosphomutase
MKMKLLVIGIDAFSYRMVRKTENKYLSELINDSRYGISVSELIRNSEPFTGPNWACLYTGVKPSSHGITDEGWKLDNEKYQDIKVNTIFDIVDDYYTQSLMTLPLTFPAFKVNGWMISGFPTPNSLENCYYPDDIKFVLGKNFSISFEKCVKGMGWKKINEPKEKLNLKKMFNRLAKNHVKTFKKIYSKRSTDIVFLGLTYIDRVNHLYTQKEHKLREAYLEIYEIIEDLIKFCKPESLVICSDHGFKEDESKHDEFGFYLIRSPHFNKKRKDISIINIAPSILKILGIKDGLGKPVKRERKKIGGRQEQEMKERLKALGYID